MPATPQNPQPQQPRLPHPLPQVVLSIFKAPIRRITEETNHMRYMFLIYSDENEQATPEVLQEVVRGHRAVMEEAGQKGILHGAEPLKPTSTATTVRTQNGRAVTLDGPFAETKEQLAGYYILDCDNLDEAIEWAKKIPTGCKGGEGCIEIRPLEQKPQKPQH